MQQADEVAVLLQLLITHLLTDDRHKDRKQHLEVHTSRPVLKKRPLSLGKKKMCCFPYSSACVSQAMELAESKHFLVEPLRRQKKRKTESCAL